MSRLYTRAIQRAQGLILNIFLIFTGLLCPIALANWRAKVQNIFRNKKYPHLSNQNRAPKAAIKYLYRQI